jgi:hypothetical protein
MPKDERTKAIDGVAGEVKRLGLTLGVTNQLLAKLVTILSKENEDGPVTAGQEEAVQPASSGESDDQSALQSGDSEEQEG